MTTNKNYVIYTVITGGFDTIKQPTVIDPRFDYILFTDTVTEDKLGVWSVRAIAYDCPDTRKKSRFPKIRPESVLSEYQASLYIDGNIRICSQWGYDRCIELADQGTEWAGIKHQGRKCLYDEINAIIGLGWVHDYEVLDWYRFLKKDGLPEQNDMFENNIIFRLNTENVRAVDSLWWWTIEKDYVKRDQFSLMWALWKIPGIRSSFFLDESENAWHNNGHFICESHNPHKRLLDKSLWEKLRDRYVRKFYSSDGWEIYYTYWFDKLLKFPFPHLARHMWTGWILFRYDLIFIAKRVWYKLRGKQPR